VNCVHTDWDTTLP